MVGTMNWYQAKIPYTAVGNGKKTETMMVVTGFDDKILATTDCNGKTYNKLFTVKTHKTKTPDEAVQYDMDKIVKKLLTWMKDEMNGQDLYKHDLKTNRTMNGMPLGGWFEMQLEAFMYGEDYAEDEEAWLEMLWEEDDRCFS